MNHRPPQLTAMSQLLIACMDRASRLSRPRAMVSSITLFLVVAAIDTATGAHLNVSFLYLLACAFAVWSLGEGGGIVIGLGGACLMGWVRHGQIGHGLPPIGATAEAWNFVARLLSFGLVAVTVSGLRNVLALERWRGTHDDLTGALNKAGFERAMATSLGQARTRNGNLLLAYMDLDGFKAVNDRFGHASGDHVLCAFADAARGSIRPGDLFARIGGDEFVTLLSIPPQVDGHRVAELLHRRLTTLLGQTGFDVTCSMGALFFPAGEAAGERTILEQADALMYEVKRSGKNAFRVARGSSLGTMLRTCYSPVDGDELDELLKRIDLAEGRRAWSMRRAA